MRPIAISFALALILTGCNRTETTATRPTDADTAAYKAGKVAHKVADETEELGKKAAVKLREAGKSAERGWKDAKPKYASVQ